VENEFVFSGQGPVAASCEHDSEPSSSIKAGKFLTSRTTINFSGRALLYEVTFTSITELADKKQTHLNRIKVVLSFD
jgi:hypothetical protein